MTPLTFDVVHAVARGEIERKQRGYQRLWLIVVPPIDERRRATAHPFPLDHQQWRLRQLVTPLAGLIGHVPSITFCGTRTGAQRLIDSRLPNVFPADYDVDRPKEIYWFSHLMAVAESGDDVRVIAAPNHARVMVNRWLADHARGRRAITITLREASYSDVRNSCMAAWAEFVRDLDPDRYMAIVLRDISTAHIPLNDDWGPALICPPAVWNVTYRTALYERAWINLFVNNGPAVLAYLNRHPRFAILKMVADVYEAREQHQRRLGVEPGLQYPFSSQDQRLVWENDDPGRIHAAFEALEATATGDAATVARVSTATGGNVSQRIRHSALQWQRSGNIQEANLDLRRLLDDQPGNAEALAHHAVLLRELDRPNEALSAVRLAVLIAPDNPWVRDIWVATAIDLSGREADSPGGNLADAGSWLDVAVRMAPGLPGPRRLLAQVQAERATRLTEVGGGERAHRLRLEAAALDPADPVLKALALASHADWATALAGSGAMVSAVHSALAAWRLDSADPAGNDALARILADPKLHPEMLDGHHDELAMFATDWLTRPGAGRDLVVPALVGAVRQAAPRGLIGDGDSALELDNDSLPGALAARPLAVALLCEARLESGDLEAIAPHLLALRAGLLAAPPTKLTPAATEFLAALACQADRQAHRWPAHPDELDTLDSLADRLAETGGAAGRLSGMPVPALIFALYRPLRTIEGFVALEDPDVEMASPMQRLMMRI